MTRCRTTDRPTARLTMKPARRSSSGAISMYTTRRDRPLRRPERITRVNSSRRVNRKPAGNTGVGVAQAESRSRPLRRRAAMIARPARVRIRSRKPCLRARRRLFGWKVRLPLLTVGSRRRHRTSRSRRSISLDAGMTVLATSPRRRRPATWPRLPRPRARVRLPGYAGREEGVKPPLTTGRLRHPPSSALCPSDDLVSVAGHGAAPWALQPPVRGPSEDPRR